MNSKKIGLEILSTLAILIGLYMIVIYIGVSLPPTLSGFAFVALGIRALIVDWTQ